MISNLPFLTPLGIPCWVICLAHCVYISGHLLFGGWKWMFCLCMTRQKHSSENLEIGLPECKNENFPPTSFRVLSGQSRTIRSLQISSWGNFRLRLFFLVTAATLTGPLQDKLRDPSSLTNLNWELSRVWLFLKRIYLPLFAKTFKFLIPLSFLLIL